MLVSSPRAEPAIQTPSLEDVPIAVHKLYHTSQDIRTNLNVHVDSFLSFAVVNAM